MSTFYIVLNLDTVTTRGTRLRYATREQAVRRARALAGRYGQEYYVLKAVCRLGDKTRKVPIVELK